MFKETVPTSHLKMVLSISIVLVGERLIIFSFVYYLLYNIGVNFFIDKSTNRNYQVTKNTLQINFFINKLVLSTRFRGFLTVH